MLQLYGEGWRSGEVGGAGAGGGGAAAAAAAAAGKKKKAGCGFEGFLPAFVPSCLFSFVVVFLMAGRRRGGWVVKGFCLFWAVRNRLLVT